MDDEGSGRGGTGASRRSLVSLVWVVAALLVAASLAVHAVTWRELNRANDQLADLEARVADLDRAGRQDVDDLVGVVSRVESLEVLAAPLPGIASELSRLGWSIADLEWRVDDTEGRIDDLAHCLYREIVGRYFTYWSIGESVTNCD